MKYAIVVFILTIFFGCSQTPISTNQNKQTTTSSSDNSPLDTPSTGPVYGSQYLGTSSGYENYKVTVGFTLVSNATSYDLYYNFDNPPVGDPVGWINVTANSYQFQASYIPPQMAGGQNNAVTYYFQLRARNATTNSAWSSVSSYTFYIYYAEQL